LWQTKQTHKGLLHVYHEQYFSGKENLRCGGRIFGRSLKNATVPKTKEDILTKIGQLLWVVLYAGCGLRVSWTFDVQDNITVLFSAVTVRLGQKSVS
jgi:hypothetical protein